MIDTDYYPHPVSLLLKHGPIQSSEEEWFDYVKGYGIGETDVPLLINMAQGIDVDESAPVQRDAPIHACRALGQLGDVAAIEALIQLIHEDAEMSFVDAVFRALSMLGPESLDALRQHLYAPSTSLCNQTLAVYGFSTFAEHRPEFRDECVQFLRQSLAKHLNQHPELNASLVDALVEIEASEALDDIKQAFQSRRVEDSFGWTWASVKAALG